MAGKRDLFNGSGAQWSILAIDSDIDDELVDASFNAVWTVEPV